MALRKLRLSQATRQCQNLRPAGTSRAINPHLTRLRVTSLLRPNTRSLSSSQPAMVSSLPATSDLTRALAVEPLYSTGQPADLPSRATSLLHSSPWSLTPSRKAIVRSYYFKTFKAAWTFMNLVADECKKQRHHPSWHNQYNEVTIEWTTHKPEGLSIKDVQMAEFCERAAKEGGAVEEGRQCCS